MCLSLHTIYHINKNKQKKAIEKLLSISKRYAPIIIIYSNPNTILSKIKNTFTNKKNKKNLYFFCHPISWWKKFEKKGKVKFYPWNHSLLIIKKFCFLIIFLEKSYLKFYFTWRINLKIFYK